MKLAKASEQEIDDLLAILNEVQQLSKDIRQCYVSDNDFSHYEIMKRFDNSDAEKFLTDLVGHISGIHFQRILFNLITLLENCADPDLPHLDFNAKIKAGLELLEKQSHETTN